MRKVLVVLGVVAVCLIIATLAFRAYFDVNRYRPQIEASLQQKFGRPVHLGDMKVTLLPFGFGVSRSTIAEDPAFGGGPFATIETLYVQPRLFPLLRGTVEIHSLQLNSPRLEVIRNANGGWNFTSLLGGRPLSLAKLRIDNGQVAITDLLEHAPRAVYDHIDLTLSDYVPNKPFDVQARLHMPGAGEQIIAFDGKAGPIRSESLMTTPFDGKLELQQIALSALQHFLNWQSLANSDAVLTGKGEIQNDGVLASKGHMEVRDALIRGVKLGYPIEVEYDVRSNTNEKTVLIHGTNVKLNQTPVSIDGSIDGATTPPDLDLHVRTQNGSIGEMARLAAAFGIAFNAASETTGRLSFDVRARGPADRPVLEGNVSGRDIRISGGEVREPVELAALDVSFSPASIRSNEFTAKTGKTSVVAQVAIDDYATDVPRIHASLNTGNAEVGELVRVARAYGLSGEDGLTGSGFVTMHVAVDGPLKQRDSWVYSGDGAVSNASLSLPSLASKPLDVRTANLRFTADSLVVDNLAFSIGQTTARGSFTAHNLAAPRVEFSLSADKINAAEWHEMAQPKPESKPSKQGMKPSLLARATGSGQLSAQTVTYDQIVLSDVRAAVKLDEGLITMSPITAGLYSGQEVGTIVVNVRNQPASYAVNSKLENVDANLLLSSISSLKETLHGVMSASTNGRFAIDGGASNIARSLNGTVSLNLANGKLANMDLLHQLASIGKFSRTARAVEPFTRLIRLNGDFAITNGVARTNNLQAVIDEGSLAADGTLDLVDQKLNLHLTAVLSQNYSQTVGGTGIAGLMNTVLPNRKGEFVIPILLTGTFKNPQFAPDVATLARMKLENLLPTLANPDKLSTGILADVLGRSPNTSPQEQPGPANLLRDIFQGVFGNKSQ